MFMGSLYEFLSKNLDDCFLKLIGNITYGLDVELDSLFFECA